VLPPHISVLVRYIIIITLTDEVIERGYVFSNADADNAKFQIESQQVQYMRADEMHYSDAFDFDDSCFVANI